MKASLALPGGGRHPRRHDVPPAGATVGHSAAAPASLDDPLWVWACQIVRERFPLIAPVALCVRCRCDLFSEDIGRACGEPECPLESATSDPQAVVLGVADSSGAPSSPGRPDPSAHPRTDGGAPLTSEIDGPPGQATRARENAPTARKER